MRRPFFYPYNYTSLSYCFLKQSHDMLETSESLTDKYEKD